LDGWERKSRAGSGLSPKVRLGHGLLLNNEQARTGLGFGLSPAGPNLGNSGPTSSGFKREMHRLADREIDRQKEHAGRQINRWTERQKERKRERDMCLLNT
jgi:hypothetical protein